MALQSSYNDGNLWSVELSGTSVYTGAGASVHWRRVVNEFASSAIPACNKLVFNMRSNANRQAHMFVDNVTVVPA